MSNNLYSTDGRSLEKINVSGIFSVMNELEAAGNIWGMNNLLEVAMSQMGRCGSNDDLQTLKSLQNRVACAQEREKIAGGHGALIVPNHWLNVELRKDILAHVDLVPWWDSRVLSSVSCSSDNGNTAPDEKR